MLLCLFSITGLDKGLIGQGMEHTALSRYVVPRIPNAGLLAEIYDTVKTQHRKPHKKIFILQKPFDRV